MWLKIWLKEVRSISWLLLVDCTRYYYVYLKNKDKALKMFKHFKNEVENQLGKQIKKNCIDWVGEYIEPTEEFCLKFGIIHQIMAPYSLQLNDIVEYNNWILKEMINIKLINLGLPQNLLEESNPFNKSQSQ